MSLPSSTSMGGSSLNEKWETGSLPNGPETVSINHGSDSDSPSNEARTVGQTGNGKSATGNSILGRKAFMPRASSSSVEVSHLSKMQTAKLIDGRILNVIDTPGLFDFSSDESEFVGEEISEVINWAKDGIDAVLIVFSVRTRFTKEEESVLYGLQALCGTKINDYIVVVFTGGDSLEEDEVTLDDYLGCECPDPLKEILQQCGNRRVLFDNKTKDEGKKTQQLEQFLFLLDGVIAQNGGQPYKEKLNLDHLNEEAVKLVNQAREIKSMTECSRERSEFKEQMHRSYQEQMKKLTNVVGLDLEKKRLEQQLTEERAASLEAEERARATQKMMEELDNIRRWDAISRCDIL